MLAVLLVYVFAYFFNPTLVWAGLDNFIKLLWPLLPALFLVFLLIYIFNLLFGREFIKKYLSQEIGAKKYFLAIALGIVSSGPIYAWYPLLADFKEEGMNNGLIAAFLYARSIKPPLIPLMVVYFSLPLVIVIVVLTLAFSILNGLIVNFFVKK